MTDPTTTLRDQIREAVVGAECERTPKCADCIADAVLTICGRVRHDASARPTLTAETAETITIPAE